MNELAVERLDRRAVVAVAREGARLAPSLPAGVRARVDAARGHVERIAGGDSAVYGVTTGFGALATTRISAAQRKELQHALLRSHAAGAGDFVAPEVVRAMMAIRAKTLAAGYSGVRAELIEALIRLLNAGVVPAVPEYGSLGASGDLAPLSHIGLCLCGEGWALDNGRAIPAAQALERAGLEPVELEVKEGLSLINGTDGMLAMLVLAIADLECLLDSADVTAAMTLEAVLGTDRVFRPELHRIRPHPGQTTVAARLLKLLEGSAIMDSHRESAHLVQDAYSLRCTPQVHGAARDTLDFAVQVAERELASVTDNPVVLADGRVESGGNFHGEPLAFALDFLAIAAAEVGAIAERRIDRLLDAHRSEGLPPFLAPQAGTHSGFMVAHYTAVSLADDNRRLATPASVGSLPTSAMQEDHNSMGWSAARKLVRVVDNLNAILAIEALAAAQALDLRAPLDPARATAAARAAIRAHVAFQAHDRFMAQDIHSLTPLLRQGLLTRAVAPFMPPTTRSHPDSGGSP